MSKLYDVHLKVPASLLTAVVELVEGEGIVVKLGENGDTAAPMRGAPRKRRHVEPGRSTEEVAVAVLAQYDAQRLGMNIGAVGLRFKAYGYSRWSAGKALYRAEANGWVQQLARGFYALTDKGEAILPRHDTNISPAA